MEEKMRLNAKQVDADRRQARAYADDALREAVCRWIVDNKASRARTARAFGISVERVGNFQFQTLMKKQTARYWAKMRGEPIIQVASR
ncbi:hypothetical protein BRX43_03595 [Sphingomonas sp. S-NIH.Pt15_0812]|nr:hypothetical protein BRX43_03595 [Sphingomonas sp. S-NIH.Pt15_0812]